MSNLHRLKEVAVNDERLELLDELDTPPAKRVHKPRFKRDSKGSPKEQLRLLRRSHPRNK